MVTYLFQSEMLFSVFKSLRVVNSFPGIYAGEPKTRLLQRIINLTPVIANQKRGSNNGLYIYLVHVCALYERRTYFLYPVLYV